MVDDPAEFIRSIMNPNVGHEKTLYKLEQVIDIILEMGSQREELCYNLY